MGFIFGFVGAFVTFAGILCALFGAWPFALTFLSWGLALMAVETVVKPPGSAFDQAGRGSKTVWLTSAMLGLIPPLGIVYFALWIKTWRTVYGAWAAVDPAAIPPRARRRLGANLSSGSYASSPSQTSSSTGGGGPCGVCGGRGWHYSDGAGNKMPCYACGGSGRR